MTEPVWNSSDKEFIKFLVIAVIFTVLASQLIQGCNEYNKLQYTKVTNVDE